MINKISVGLTKLKWHYVRETAAARAFLSKTHKSFVTDSHAGICRRLSVQMQIVAK